MDQEYRRFAEFLDVRKLRQGVSLRRIDLKRGKLAQEGNELVQFGWVEVTELETNPQCIHH